MRSKVAPWFSNFAVFRGYKPQTSEKRRSALRLRCLIQNLKCKIHTAIQNFY